MSKQNVLRSSVCSCSGMLLLTLEIVAELVEQSLSICATQSQCNSADNQTATVEVKVGKVLKGKV